PSTRRSTSDYCVFLGDNLLSWSAKRQHTISRSSAEAEYQGVANVVAETAWLCNLLRELHSFLLTATLVYCDNVSAVYMSANPIVDSLHKEFDMTDLEALNYFLGISDVRHPTWLFLSQKKYALHLLERAHMLIVTRLEH
nr:ribonuclease H-like domain-containing protein [Tanacetum cinerariifolium]